MVIARHCSKCPPPSSTRVDHVVACGQGSAVDLDVGGSNGSIDEKAASVQNQHSDGVRRLATRKIAAALQRQIAGLNIKRPLSWLNKTPP